MRGFGSAVGNRAGWAADAQSDGEAGVAVDALFLHYRVRIAAFLSEPSDLRAPAVRLETLSRDHGQLVHSAVAAIFRGYGVAHDGDPDTGRAMIVEGLDAYAATGAAQWSCYYRALLAETHAMLGDTEAALQVLADALEETQRTGERWYDAELHRRVGEVHWQCGDARAAEACFRQALAIARDQGARLWELAAAASQARLWRDQGKRQDAHDLLAPIYGWFSEGLDTPPLTAARTLLETLMAP